MHGVQVPFLAGELRSHMPHGQKNQNTKQKQYCNKFNKGFKDGPHTHTNLKKKKSGSDLPWLPGMPTVSDSPQELCAPSVPTSIKSLQNSQDAN